MNIINLLQLTILNKVWVYQRYNMVLYNIVCMRGHRQ